MTKDEFKTLQSLLGWTNRETAEVLKVDISTVDRWRSGSLPVNKTAGELLKLKRKEQLRNRSITGDELI